MQISNLDTVVRNSIVSFQVHTLWRLFMRARFDIYVFIAIRDVAIGTKKT